MIGNHPVFSLVSTQEEVDQLAQELADDYVQYFDVDTSQEQEKLQDAIEECLAHLEEVISAVDELKQNFGAVDKFASTLSSYGGTLNRFYSQVDAVEVHILDMSRQLDELEAQMVELERQQSAKGGRLRQFIGKIIKTNWN